MRFSNIVVFCLSLTVLCTQLESPSTIEVIRSKMLNSYREAVRYGKECARRMCKLFEEGKDMISSKFLDITYKIRKGREEIATPTDVDKEDSASGDISNLTPEEVERLIEDIKRRFAEYMGNEEEMKYEDNKEDENKENENKENEDEEMEAKDGNREL